MAYLSRPIAQHFARDALNDAVRASIGKSLRRAAALNQLALIGALACVPLESRQHNTALLWQSTSGPRRETQTLLREVCAASGEAMPYDFLAIQPAIAGPQIHAFLPGLQAASYFPLDQENAAQWSLVLNLALDLLATERHAQILCAHIELTEQSATGHWLSLSQSPVASSVIQLQRVARPATAGLPAIAVPHGMPARDDGERRGNGDNFDNGPSMPDLPDTPDFPQHLGRWLELAGRPAIHLQSPAIYRQALKFTRL